MRHVRALALLCLLPLIGCNTDDLPRLMSINERFNQGEYEYALDALTEYTKDYPDSFTGWGSLGWANVKLNRLDAGKECFEKSLALNPKWDNAYVGLGAIHRKQADLIAARSAYLKAIQIMPDNAEAFSSLLVIEIIEENYAKAVEYGEKSWALRKDLASIPANLAVAYHYLGNEEKKWRYFNEAKRMNYPKLEVLEEIFADSLTIE